MEHQLWRSLLVVVAVALAGCAASGGATPAETRPAVAAAPAPTAPPVEEAAPPPALASEEPPFNRVKWSTASEVDNFGFDIYRSTAEDGPFERLTSQPIPGAGTVDEPRYYEYKDTSIDPSVEYFYYVESISVDGIREKFSPTIRAPAKRPKVSEGASESAP